MDGADEEAGSDDGGSRVYGDGNVAGAADATESGEDSVGFGGDSGRAAWRVEAAVGSFSASGPGLCKVVKLVVVLSVISLLWLFLVALFGVVFWRLLGLVLLALGRLAGFLWFLGRKEWVELYYHFCLLQKSHLG